MNAKTASETQQAINHPSVQFLVPPHKEKLQKKEEEEEGGKEELIDSSILELFLDYYCRQNFILENLKE